MVESPPFWMWIIGFLLVLGPLVTVHELGHYLVARIFGVQAEAFSVGFGKELWGKTDRHGTRWKLSTLPLGGYVQFKGDMNPASIPDAAELARTPPEEKAGNFHFAPLWKRALIVAAGPVTNFVVAVAILAGFALAYGRMEVEPIAYEVVEGGAAAEAGILPGDRIVAMDGDPVGSFRDISNRVVQDPGGTVVFDVERDGSRQDIDVAIATVKEVDRFGNEFRIGQIGILSPPGVLVPVGPIEAVTSGVSQTGEIVAMMVQGIGQIISGRRPLEELGGPIKIAKFSAEQLSLGWQSYVWFVAMISINLAFINLLPIPALDGGHLAFYAAEAVRRKPVGARSQEWAFRTGVAFVIALMLFVTINDFASLPIFGG